MDTNSATLKELLLATKDGDWGKDIPQQGFIPYRVIRGADFPNARLGDTTSIPLCYLDEKTVSRRTLIPNDIIIETAGGNRDRPTGRTLFVTERLLSSLDLPATCASFCRFLRVNPAKAEANYVFWYLQHLYQMGKMWEHQVQHTGVARFQYTKFAQSVEIPLPDLAEQRRIASTLSALDEKIELNLHMNATLQAITQATFKRWFVDLQFPGFDGELVDGLPKGWRGGTLSDVIEVKGGTTPSTKESEYWDGEFYWATPKDLSNLHSPVLLDTERKITEKGVKQISSGVLPEGTLLLSSRAPIGYLAIAQMPVSINQGFIAIQGKSVSNLFMLFWLKQNMESIESRAGGSTFQEINKANFREIGIVIPDKVTLKQFDNFVAPVFDKLVVTEKQNLALTNLRDSLLPKLISGKIRVAE